MTNPNPPAPPGTGADNGATDPNTPAAGSNPPANSNTDADEGDDAKSPTFKGEYNEDQAKQLIANLRTEKATEKQKRQAAEKAAQTQLDALAKAMGLKSDDDPAEIAKKLAEEQKRSKDAVVELAVLKACIDPKVGANSVAILDSRSFLSKVADLDHTSDTFQADVAKAVSAAVAANPLLKNGTAKGSKSGADFSAGASSAPPEPKTPHQRLMRAFSNSSGSS